MKHAMAVCLAAALVLAFSSAAGAATIVWSGELDTTTQLNWEGTYGGGGAYYWDYSSGQPDYTKPHGTNPDFVDSFNWGYGDSGGSSGWGGGGWGGSGVPSGVGDENADMQYALVLSESKKMDFTVFFYDRDYGTRNSLENTDIALQVRLIDPGADEAQHDQWRDITVGDLANGVYATWQVEALAGETILTEVIWVEGDGVGAAGFFLDNVEDIVEVPEPATMALLATGLAGIAAFKRRRSNRR